MLKLALVCAVGCSSSIPALAGERSVAPPGIRAIPHRAVPVRPAAVHAIPVREVPGARAATPVIRAATTFVLPAAKRGTFDLRASAESRRLVAIGNVRPAATPVSPFALPEPRPQPAWQLTGKFPEVTARAGARYAVGDTLADHRRVGPPRSALDAMLVFRIDGSNDSPPLSVGGGVAGAMWKAGVTR